MELPNSNPTGKYDPGQIMVLFDNRDSGPPSDNSERISTFQSYYLHGLQRLGWPSYWYPPDLEPGKLRLIWYTHTGNEGRRDYPLHMAYTVKEMFDSLAVEGFRPMILGFSNENPFPMIGGSEPPPEPTKPKMKVAASASGAWSGHAGAKAGGTPHERVMAIIEKEEEREAVKRKEEVERAKKADGLAV